ncbi:Uncharacterised protein [Mycobacteroides abscessus subsp. massiliense]|nr:Uncharacterised protein [Mycobacteroides abscessus subsp. massiliense]
MVDGGLDLLVGGDAGGQAFALQQIEDAPAPLNVVIGQVQLGDLRIGQFHVVAVLVALEKLALDHPVDLGVDLREILAFNGIKGAAPELDDLLDLLVGFAGVQMLDGTRVVLALDVQRAGLPSSGESHGAPSGEIVADLADGPDRVVQREVTERDAGLDHLQHQRRRAHLEHGGGLRHVGVADDDVQASVLLGIGVRFVAGVDDGTATGGGRRHTFPNMFGTLR